MKIVKVYFHPNEVSTVSEFDDGTKVYAGEKWVHAVVYSDGSITKEGIDKSRYVQAVYDYEGGAPHSTMTEEELRRFHEICEYEPWDEFVEENPDWKDGYYE